MHLNVQKLERFSNTRALPWGYAKWLFLEKQPLGITLSVYRNRKAAKTSISKSEGR
jgi:hypothetical protein